MHPGRSRPDLRPVAPQPEDLRPDRLRGQRVAGPRQQPLDADRRRQLLDLRRRPTIDAVEHRVRQRRPRRVDRQHARPDRAACQRPGSLPADPLPRPARGRWRRSRPTSPPRRHAPPSRAAAPASGARRRAVATIAAASVNQHPLRFEGADVDAEIAHVQASRSRLEPGSRCRAIASTSSRASAARSPSVADLERGVRVAHRKAEIDAGDARCELHIGGLGQRAHGGRCAAARMPASAARRLEQPTRPDAGSVR